MIPSQVGWPFLPGTNEDPTGQPCGPAPLAQVKILRRPKPHEISQRSQPTSGRDKKLTTPSGPVGLEHKSEQTSRPSSSFYVNEDEWPSIADAESKNLGSQKRKYNVLKKPPDAKFSSNGGMNPATPHEPVAPSIMGKTTIGAGNTTSSAQSDTFDTSKAPKAPIKTYKERADEYAKARLRILGSAFSDDDKADNDDIAYIQKGTADG